MKMICFFGRYPKIDIFFQWVKYQPNYCLSAVTDQSIKNERLQVASERDSVFVSVHCAAADRALCRLHF
jgi:hypothetical protein